MAFRQHVFDTRTLSLNSLSPHPCCLAIFCPTHNDYFAHVDRISSFRSTGSRNARARARVCVLQDLPLSTGGSLASHRLCVCVCVCAPQQKTCVSPSLDPWISLKYPPLCVCVCVRVSVCVSNMIYLSPYSDPWISRLAPPLYVCVCVCVCVCMCLCVCVCVSNMRYPSPYSDPWISRLAPPLYVCVCVCVCVCEHARVHSVSF